jgi:hypothetical protein
MYLSFIVVKKGIENYDKIYNIISFFTLSIMILFFSETIKSYLKSIKYFIYILFNYYFNEYIYRIYKKTSVTEKYNPNNVPRDQYKNYKNLKGSDFIKKNNKKGK